MCHSEGLAPSFRDVTELMRTYGYEMTEARKSM